MSVVVHGRLGGRIALVSTVAAVALAVAAKDGVPAGTGPGPKDGAFFEGACHEMDLLVLPADLAQLREHPRRYVPATVRSQQATVSNIAVRLKGSTGSFRSLDDKPAFTLDVSRFDPDRRFLGLRRLYLNNSVEDPSLLCEQLGGELFRAAGLPAPRTAQARVTLNGRPLGLYVVQEGFTEEFLGAYFDRRDGCLYDNDWGCDVDQTLKQNLGSDGVAGRQALAAVARAVREPDVSRRMRLLEQVLDTERFVTFMVMEVMLGHRDGYCCGRNNFRIYHDPGMDRLVFLPDGMDQLFGLPEFPWKPRMSGLVASGFLETVEGQGRYRQRFTELLEGLLAPSKVTARVDALVGDLSRHLTRAEARRIEGAAVALKQRIVARQRSLCDQLARPEPGLLAFEAGEAWLREWSERDAASAERMGQGRGPDGRVTLEIVARERTSAAWRAQVMLAPGRYRFEGQARVAGVEPLAVGRQQGGTLRVVGEGEAGGRLLGTTGWRTLAAEFEVRGQARVVGLLCELRASGGRMWVDRDSLRLVRLTRGET